ncbi:MAG: exonuclease domain-containing protein [Bacteroidota bacterium]|nr:exonuclease domain-containing protein [Bacteroidota bacterium]
MEFAVVDIETTGGSPPYHRIVEIAIVIHNGIEVVDRFDTLINPERNIPFSVSMIHGITNEMVAEAPKFYEVAKQIYTMTENRIFVAHSVNFDFNFIKSEFEALGGEFQRKKMCTVRLSRKLIPGHKSYSLGNICSELGIKVNNRHRALGDAEATAELLTRCLIADKEGKEISRFLNARSKETTLPPNLDKSKFDALPMTTGVYYFYDINGKVIYVGKAKNIKDRVSQHFSGNTHTKNRQLFLSSIYDVDCEMYGHELIALLAENESIKKYYPRYNRANKTFDLNAGIYVFEDQKGYKRAIVGRAGKHDKPIAIFKTQSEAFTELIKLTMDNRLCLKLNGLLPEKNVKCNYNPDSEEQCLYCNENASAGKYNKSFDKAFATINSNKTFVIKTPGRKRDEESFVFVENGKFLGYGHINKEETISSIDELKNYLNICYDTQDSQSIIHSYIGKAKMISKEPVMVFQLS